MCATIHQQFVGVGGRVVNSFTWFREPFPPVTDHANSRHKDGRLGILQSEVLGSIVCGKRSKFSSVLASLRVYGQ